MNTRNDPQKSDQAIILCKKIEKFPNVRRFFVGWPKPPSQERFESILRGSTLMVIAIDPASNETIGFATAITDGVFSGYISLVEVVPEFQGKGIGTMMVKDLLARMSDLYMIDAVCDTELEPFYEKFGMKKYSAMSLRNYLVL